MMGKGATPGAARRRRGPGGTAPGSEGEGGVIREYIVRIINVILEDPSLDDETRADFLRDAETLNMQLQKSRRNGAVIRCPYGGAVESSQPRPPGGAAQLVRIVRQAEVSFS